MACRSGCPTQDHDSWGQCARASSLRVGWSQHAKGLDKTEDRKWEGELNLYRSAREQGVQPQTTHSPDVKRALDLSDKTGTAYRA